MSQFDAARHGVMQYLQVCSMADMYHVPSSMGALYS